MKRGRKPGTASAPRQIFAVCIGKDCYDEICIGPNDKNVSNDDFCEQAKILFEEKHGTKPNVVYGPYHHRKGQFIPKKRSKIPEINEEEVHFKRNSTFVAEFNGWEVSATHIKEQDDVVYVRFRQELLPGEKKRAKPASRWTYVDDLTIKEQEEEPVSPVEMHDKIIETAKNKGISISEEAEKNLRNMFDVDKLQGVMQKISATPV